MAKMEIIKRNSKEILNIDLSGLSEKEMENSVDSTIDAVIKQGSRNPMLVLIDVTGTKIGSGVVSILKNRAEDVLTSLETVAVVGLGGMKKMLLEMAAPALPFRIKTLKDPESAIRWLTD
ncbi:MAG: hypothetical protein JW737_07545 [Acidobacteria bacterium]|nr:hypothetical protein [Acidobacteriota bacterium]